MVVAIVTIFNSPGGCDVKGVFLQKKTRDWILPLTHHNPRDLGLICLVKKRKIRFRILLDSCICPLGQTKLSMHNPAWDSEHPLLCINACE